MLLAHAGFLVLRSVRQWEAGAVSQDFAIFFQAWSLIGSGDLSPYSTIIDEQYWRSHFEILMWPLAILNLVFPSGVTLLVVQVLATVGAEAIAVLWVLEASLRRRDVRLVHLLPAAVTLALFVTNDRIVDAARLDFHFQAIATFAVIGAARATWRGRRLAPWLWVALALSTGDVAGTYVAGLGLSAVIARRDTRRTGVALILAGGAWTGTIGLIGASTGSALSGYQHLFDQPIPAGGTALIFLVTFLVLHPVKPLSVIAERSGLILTEYSGSGLVGAFHPWAVGVVAVVMVSGVLQESLSFFASFQNFPAIVFATAGTGLTLDWLSRRIAASNSRALVATRTAAVAVAVVLAATVFTRGPALKGFPEPPGAEVPLQQVDKAIRPDDQVIASFGLVGRFAGRAQVDYLFVPRTFALTGDRVMFVFSTTIGNGPTPRDQMYAALTAREIDGATTVVDTKDVVAVTWRPPAGVTEVTIPVPSP